MFQPRFITFKDIRSRGDNGPPYRLVTLNVEHIVAIEDNIIYRSRPGVTSISYRNGATTDAIWVADMPYTEIVDLIKAATNAT